MPLFFFGFLKSKHKGIWVWFQDFKILDIAYHIGRVTKLYSILNNLNLINMLPFNENKKRKRQGLTVEHKKWVCEQKKCEPAITSKNLALLLGNK